MSNSIYNISAHTSSASQKYALNDIVKNGDYHYYCIQAHDNAAGAQTPSTTSTYWNGTTNFGSDGVLPYFFWRPAYNYTLKWEPRNRVIAFGDGYEQRAPDGIQNNLMTLDLTFDVRGEDEATAILHFLHTRNGAEAFVFYPPKPYNVSKKFRAPNWDMSSSFQGNFSIRTTFLETSM